jgi:hypothetical protein
METETVRPPPAPAVAPTALNSVFRAGRWRDSDEAAGFDPNALVRNSTRGTTRGGSTTVAS